MSDAQHPCKATCSGWKQGHEEGLKVSGEINRSLANRNADLLWMESWNKKAFEFLMQFSRGDESVLDAKDLVDEYELREKLKNEKEKTRVS